MKKIEVGSTVNFSRKHVERIFLAEFSKDTRKGIVPAENGTQKEFNSVHIYRLINHKREQVALNNVQTLLTDLSCLVGVKSPILVTANPPSPGHKGYKWRLIELGTINTPSDIIIVTGQRDADVSETTLLNKMFPTWLEQVERLDHVLQNKSTSVKS